VATEWDFAPAVTTPGALEGRFNHTTGIILNRRPEIVVRLNPRTYSPVAPAGQPNQDDHCAAGTLPVPGTEKRPARRPRAAAVRSPDAVPDGPGTHWVIGVGGFVDNHRGELVPA
jgi:hypothetical protein